RDTVIWLVGLVVFGWLGYRYWGTIWAVPAFAAYGVLYGSATDSRWHECGHATAFKTRWMNEVIFHMASFMVLREPVSWRWSHTRHHADTIVVGRDPEIAVPRPPDIVGILLNLFALKSGVIAFRNMILHAGGRMTAAEKTYVPEAHWPGAYRTARIWIAIYLVVMAWAITAQSILPLMYVGLPSFYGAWLVVVHGLTQHAGMAEDVLDHRLNTRTVYMNPINRFIYWNMNYHLEHHMYPPVPYHALKQLHEEMRPYTPKPYPNMLAAYREIIPALLKQRKDPSYYVQRELPTPVEA
ncbi:MAG: fatty acid desaturase, partial [Verrucomicrobia bacterium]|nr:fatty acid desaturase [Verrucomicrobiota bacterium]